VLEASLYLLSIQTQINGVSDILADATASAADKLAAAEQLAHATLAYAEAQSLMRKYTDLTLEQEALEIADALLAAQAGLLAAESAYALDATAENLAALTQALKTLQAAKDALTALDQYIDAHETSQEAQQLEDEIAQHQLDAADAQALLDAYLVLTDHSATSEEKAAARAVIDSAGMTKLQAMSALVAAQEAAVEAQQALNELLAKNGFATVQEAIVAETAAHNELDVAKAGFAAHTTANTAGQAVQDAQGHLDQANGILAAVQDLLSQRNLAQSALESAQNALDAAYQAWVDARLIKGTDEDADVQTALADYLAALTERDEKQTALSALDDALLALPSEIEAQQAVADADTALAQARQAWIDALAAQPNVVLDLFGADFAANDSIAPEQPTIHTAHNLTIHSGGSVGVMGTPISTDVGGVIRVDASPLGTVALTSPVTMHIGGVSAGNVWITANGSLLDVSPAGSVMVTADNAVLNAIGGEIGGSTAMLNVGSLSGFADQMTMQNQGALNIGRLSAQGWGIWLGVGGAVTQSVGGFVLARNFALKTPGDIGTPTSPLNTNVQNLSASGGNIYINSIGHLQSVSIKGNTVVLWVNGALYGGTVRAQNLSIYALGDIGREYAPLRVQVPGVLILMSEYGRINVVNKLLRLTFLIGIRLMNGLMLYLLIGTDIRGGLQILGMAIAKDGDVAVLNEFYEVVRSSGVSLGCAFIDGLGDSAAAFQTAFDRLFPDAALISTDVFWIAGMRGDIGGEDWYALLSDLAAVYGSTNAEEAIAATERFNANWQEKYPAAAERLNQQMKDVAAVLAATAALRSAELNYKQIVNMLIHQINQLDIPALYASNPV
jgi:hypothetical protein